MLYDIAEEEDIHLFFDLDHEELIALYHQEDDATFISFRRDLDKQPRLFRDIFAEELGHHFTSVGNSVFYEKYADRVIRDRAEYRALKWGAQFMMPAAEFVGSFRCCHTVHELADYFEVTEGLVKFRYEVLQREEIEWLPEPARLSEVG